MTDVLQHLRAVILRDVAAATDGQLLEFFIAQKDEAAFDALVRRHGAMVWGVCRRILHNHHDAEDAFQATFLVLVRKARSIRPREKVANWLHGVAYRTALKARAAAAKRHVRERPLPQMPEIEAAAPEHDPWRDLKLLLDRELNSLPDKYRLPIVLCDLEGRSIREAAQQLGWPQGTLAGRLARARTLLARRLTRRGVALSSATLAAVLSQNAASAAVPASLTGSTVKAACLVAAGQVAAGAVSAKVASLTQGMVQTMLWTKLQIVILTAVSTLVFAAGAGLVLSESQANKKTLQGKEPEASPTPKEATKATPIHEIYFAYTVNDALADEKFTGKGVIVTGYVVRVKRGYRVQVKNTVHEKSEFYQMWLSDTISPENGHLTTLEFPIEARKQLAPLARLQKITVEGRCEGLVANNTAFGDSILLRDCKLLQVEPVEKAGKDTDGKLPTK